MDELPCIVCGKELEDAAPSHPTTNQPWEANIFFSYGHYGATAFDEVNGQFLEINVCTECLIENSRRGRILKGTPSPPAPSSPIYSKWEIPEIGIEEG